MPSSRPPLAVVLVVEDDFVLRESICTVLQDAGYRVEAAATLTDARQLLKRQQVSILVLDLMLSGERGDELLHELAEEPRAPATLIVSAARDAVTTAARYDVPLIRKPFEIEHLAEAVAHVARDSRRPTPPIG